MLTRDKRTLTKLACFYSLFIIYGSLVPLHFNQLTFSAALDAFQHLNLIDISITNKSDWFTNFLLFMPLAYLLFCIIPRSKNLLLRALQLTFIAVFLLSISISIEFTQLFINERVTSFKDVFAQLLGIILSYIIYLFTRAKFIRTVNKLNHHNSPNKWQSYAQATLVIFVIYSFMPLDLSVSPVEIYNKWGAGRINLIPFGNVSLQLNERLFGLISDILIWALIAWLYVKSQKYQQNKIFKLCLSYAIAIELMQLFVLSRYTDTTDVVSALIGIILSLKISSYNNQKTNVSLAPSTAESTAANRVEQSPASLKTALFSAEAVFAFWCILLLFLSLYPAELIQSKDELNEKWQMFFSVPLETYWREGPLQAVTQLLRKILLPLPLGLILISLCFKYQLKIRMFLLAHFVVLIFVIGLEVLQILLSNKIAVLSDSLLNILGLLLGEFIYLKHTGKTTPLNGLLNGRKIHLKLYPVVIFVGIYFALQFIANSDKTPYNVRELFDQHQLWLSALMITVSLIVAFGLPAILVNTLQKRQQTSYLSLLIATLLHTALVFNLFYLTFPNESIYDILGYPTWRNWPQYVELGYRFMGFYLPTSALFFLSNCWLIKSNSIQFKSHRLAFSLIYLFIILPLAFTIIVVQAGTDNIVELLPNNGYSFKLLCLVAYLFLLIYISAWWVKAAPNTNLLKTIIATLLTLVSAPLGYYLVTHGLQNTIIKYEQVFSGLQFILSPTRKDLLTEQQILVRFIAVHFVMLLTFYISGLCSRINNVKTPSTDRSINSLA